MPCAGEAPGGGILNVELARASIKHPYNINRCVLQSPGTHFQLPLLHSIYSEQNPFQVHIFDYTLHVADAQTADRAGMHLLVRRAVCGVPLLAALVKSGGIVNATLDGLQNMLDAYQVRIKKATSKSVKIRELMRLMVVQENTTPQQREKVEEILRDMEKKRNKKKAPAADGDNGEEDAEEARHLCPKI